MKKLFQTTIIVSALIFGGVINADGTDAGKYQLDSKASQIGFYVEAKITNVRGRFLAYQTKTMNYTPGKIEELSGELLVNTSTVFTRDRKRDEHLREDDFFWVEKFPYATVVLDSVVKSEQEDQYNVTLTLNIRDKSKQYTIPTIITENDNMLRMKGKFIVDRQDFDLTGEHIANVIMDDDVEVKFDLKFREPVKSEETEESSALDDL